MKLTILAAAALTALLAPVAAQAATCQIIIYYSDSSKSRPVGSWSNCPGQKGLQGKRTRFFDRETQEIQSSPLPGRGLPCEFLVRGCRIFERRP